DGFLILGVLDEDAPAHLDERFAETSAKFGSSVATAFSTSERKVPQSFDYAVMDQLGGLKYVAGGIPLKTTPPQIPVAPYAEWFVGSDGSSIWASVINPVVNQRGERLPDSRLPRRYGSASDASSRRHLQSFCWWNSVAGDDAGGDRLLAASCSRADSVLS